jgi:hypothetical protein
MEHDPEASDQIRETRATLLDHLRAEPGDFKAMLMADVVSEIDPDRDPTLIAHGQRFRELRGDGWEARARTLGLDALLFNLCEGMHGRGIGRAALPVLARRAGEISADPLTLALLGDRMRELAEHVVATGLARALEERAPDVAAGWIDRSFVPTALVDSPHVTLRYHPSGALAHAEIDSHRINCGALQLGCRAGSLYYTGRRGGSGYAVSERYAGGAIHSTLCTPWHDGEESSETFPWYRWAAESLAKLAEIMAEEPAPRTPRPKRARSAKKSTRP